MKNKLIQALFCLLIGNNVSAMTNAEIFDAKIENIDGKKVSLEEFKGKVILFVNTASACGFTPQYNDLEEIYQKYEKQGFTILAFPSNEFGGQEPGSNQEIKKFCDLKQGKYKISFPIFGKSKVNSEPMNPIFKYLLEKANPSFNGPIQWNFEKFLVSKNGHLVKRFVSQIKPTSPEMITAITEELAK